MRYQPSFFVVYAVTQAFLFSISSENAKSVVSEATPYQDVLPFAGEQEAAPAGKTAPVPPRGSVPLTKSQEAEKALRKGWSKGGYNTINERSKLEGKDVFKDTLNEALTKEQAQNPEVALRMLKRQKARDIQEAGQTFTEVHTQAITAANIALNTASATGIPQVQGAATAGAIVLQAIQFLGKAISTTMFAVGRYRERSQEIVTVNEQLLEEIHKSLSKLEQLQEATSGKSKAVKLKQPDEEKEPPSKLKQFRKAIKGAGESISEKVGAAKEKVIQKTDFITNIKADRLEELKKNQAELKREQEYYEDNMRLLQIKLLQDSVKEIDKLIYIHNKSTDVVKDKTGKTLPGRRGTLEIIANDIVVYKANLANLETCLKLPRATAQKTPECRKVPTDRKNVEKQRLMLTQKINKSYEDQVYYSHYKDKTPQQLNADKASLIKKITELKPLTKAGRAASLQKKGIDADSVFSKDGVIELYEKTHLMQEALCSLPNKTPKIDELCSQK